MATLRMLLAQAKVPFRDKGTNVGQGFVNIPCPFCGEQKFHCGIHETELWFKCLVCGEGGQWHTLANKLRSQYSRIDWFTLGKQQFIPRYLDDTTKLPKELAELTRPLEETDIVPFEYLTEVPFQEELHDKYRPRGFEAELIKKIKPGVGIGKLKGYVTFVQGDNLIARNYSGYGARWWKGINNGVYIYGKTFVEYVQPEYVVLTEGVFDTLSVPFGHGLAILGSIMSDYWIAEAVSCLPHTTKSVILALDRGVPRKTVNRFKLLLQDCGLFVVEWDWGNSVLKDIKDLDEARLVFSRRWVEAELQKLVGLKAKENNEILHLL